MHSKYLKRKYFLKKGSFSKAITLLFYPFPLVDVFGILNFLYIEPS